MRFEGTIVSITYARFGGAIHCTIVLDSGYKAVVRDPHIGFVPAVGHYLVLDDERLTVTPDRPRPALNT